MHSQPRRLRRVPLVLLACSFVLISLPTWAAEKMRLQVDDYQIEAELTPHLHKIVARAKVRFTALEDTSIATFELHNAMRITKVLDAAGKPLSAERVTQDSTVRVQLATPVAKDSSTTLTFEYEGVLDTADDSPVQGLKLAYIGDDTSYLLYAGRWFPVNAYGINRFTATISVTVPAHMMVIGSGKESASTAPAGKRRGASSRISSSTSCATRCSSRSPTRHSCPPTGRGSRSPPIPTSSGHSSSPAATSASSPSTGR